MSSGPELPDQTDQPREAAEPFAGDLADRAERPSLTAEIEQESQQAGPAAGGPERQENDLPADRSRDSSPAAERLADQAERPSLTTETARVSQQAPADTQGQRSKAPADQQFSERPVAFTDQSSARSERPSTPPEFTPRQREQLQQYGIDPDGVASAHADRLASALTNADLAWNASRGDASAADQIRARGVSAKVESGGAPGTESPTESHLVQATDANTSLRIESTLDRATGVITRHLRFQSADGYVLNGSRSEQVEPVVVREERVAGGSGDQVTPNAGLEQHPPTGERTHKELPDRRGANQVDRVRGPRSTTLPGRMRRTCAGSCW